MFRRKEDDMNPLPANATSSSATPASSASATAEAAAVTAAAAAPAASGSATNSSSPYAPAASATRAATSASDAGRAAASPVNASGLSFRPAAMGDYGRGNPSSSARTDAASARSSASTMQTITASSFGTTSERGSGKTNRRVLTVGNDILLKGEIATCDRLVIEGRVEAKLSDVHTVEIAESGSFKGTAEVEDAEISGIFEGDLIVRNRIVIYATGEVRGNITYGEIEIERGGRLTGQIKTVASTAATGRSKPAESAYEGKRTAHVKDSTAAA